MPPPPARQIRTGSTALALALLVGGALPQATRAQSPGSHALFSRYEVRAGRETEFVEGYIRHLHWHLAARDPWAWYVWRVSTGERRGHFVGGAFGQRWTELDTRPRPGEDAADHARNIDPHLEGTAPSLLAQRPDLGGTLPLLETAPQLALFEVEVRPAEVGAFEAALREAARARAGGSYGWFEVVSGDRHPRYLLLVPVGRASELAGVRWDRFGLREGAADDPRTARALERARAAVVAVRSELLAFRPEISTCVRTESRCVGTVPGAP
ncbi:MAG TPA: hypothetical protein VHG28_24385 [Longimicrobiaceae bacterium]|nr:hypothetical protein [Longimicrobiaceae bacterium]